MLHDHHRPASRRGSPPSPRGAGHSHRCHPVRYARLQGHFELDRCLERKARERFGCRRKDSRYLVPSEFVIRDNLIRIEPDALDQALNRWNQVWGAQDDALAMDGKTMENALDKNGRQTHILSVVGYDSAICGAKKVGSLPVAGDEKEKRTSEIGIAIPVLASCDIAGKDITADALLTQRAIATYIVGEPSALSFHGEGEPADAEA